MNPSTTNCEPSNRRWLLTLTVCCIAAACAGAGIMFLVDLSSVPPAGSVSVHGRVADAEAHKRAWHTISVRRRRAAAAAEHWGVADTARTTPQTEYSTETSLTLWHRHDMKKVTS